MQPGVPGFECAAAALPEVGRGSALGGARRGSRGSAGCGGVGFQSAGDSGRGPCWDPARRCRYRCPCPAPSLFQAGRTTGPRARSVAVCGARRPGALGGPPNGGMAPRYDSLTRAPAPGPYRPPHLSPSTTSCRRDAQCWRLLLLLSTSALLPGVTRTRSATGKQPGPSAAPATSAPQNSWSWRRERLRCAPHSWT